MKVGARMTDDGHKVDLVTPDLAVANLEALEKLFPGVAADGVLDAGKLGSLLGIEVAAPTENRERYGLQWAGKQEAIRSLLATSRGTLVPDVDASTDFTTAKNTFIRGDNLEVLKLLQKAYNDEIKLIYIDPPYNTGSDFVYKDDFSDGLQGYLEYTGQLDEDGNRGSASVDIGGRRHSRWLSMMLPRLVLARNMLDQSGVLLCSINDVEFSNLMALLRDVFGEENFLATFIWNNDGNIEQQSRVKVNHEYIVAFARNIELVPRPTVIDPNIAESSKLFNAEIENSITKNGPANPESTVTLPAGFPASAPSFDVSPRDSAFPKILDPIEVRDGVLTRPARLRSGWSSRRLLDLFIENRFVPIEDAEGKESRFAVTPTGAVYLYKKRPESQGHVLSVLRNMGTTKASSSWLRKEWGVVFDYPKPERLIQHLVATFTSADDIVLDFFAGSGTTMHAVALQNAADGGRRRSISVTLPEQVPPESAAGKAGFTTIPEITLRRMNAVLASVSGSSDMGLRVLSLAPSNFRLDAPVSGTLDLVESTLVDGVASDLAVAVEIFLKEAVSLDAETVEHRLGAVTVWTGGGVAVVIGNGLDMATAEQVFNLDPKPRVVVVLEDNLAGDDALKANLLASANARGITVKTI